MDLRRARIGEWLTGASGAALAVSPALAWYSCERGAGGCRGAITGWGALAVTDVVLLIAGLIGVAVLVLTVTQRTPALPLALTTMGVPVAVLAAILALLALLFVPDHLEASGAGPARLPGAWLGALSSLGLLASLLAAMRDERIPVAGRGQEGGAPPPRTLTLSGEASRPTSAQASAEPRGRA